MKRHLRQTPRRKPAQRGFTLIELLVTISIIALIAGIGVAISGAVLRQTTASLTRTLLGQLAGAAIEYREQVGQDVELTDFDANTYSNNPLQDHESINVFTRAVKQNAQPALEMLQSINERFIPGNSFGAPLQTMPPPANDNVARNGESVLDGFDNAVRYYPGTDNLDMADEDQRAEGLPLRRTAYFASAGQDGEWGSFDAMNQPDDLAADNLYSFEVQ